MIIQFNSLNEFRTIVDLAIVSPKSIKNTNKRAYFRHLPLTSP